jgi:transposase, IS5 family
VPFDASLLVRFRERINVNLVNQINERMVIKSQREIEREDKKKLRNKKRRNNRAKK